MTWINRPEQLENSMMLRGPAAPACGLEKLKIGAQCPDISKKTRLRSGSSADK
jgi:hypothetical protein